MADFCIISEFNPMHNGHKYIVEKARELGADSAKMHFGVGKYAAEKGVALLFTFGAGAEEIARGAECAGMAAENIFRITDTENADAAAEKLKQTIKKDDIILFKASRALRLERVSSKI